MEYRSDLPERPRRMLHLPLDDRGFPVPWFVAFIDGKPDFRVIRELGVVRAHNKELCWLCGERRGTKFSFVVGPMCGVNRVTAEPPSHTECAEYAVRACPFLTKPLASRRERDMPEDAGVAGVMIKRNPGVSLLWTCKDYRPFRANIGGPGVLFRLGDPTALEFYSQGRIATREEIDQSIATGLPHLEKMAKKDGPEGIKAFLGAQRRFDRLLEHHRPLVDAQGTP